jgi:hypothetical protein
MPTPKQMEKLAAVVGRVPRRTPTPDPGDAMSPEYWDAVLRDALADASPEPPSDVDLAVMKHPPTTFVHDLASRLRCRKCAKASRRPPPASVIAATGHSLSFRKRPLCAKSRRSISQFCELSHRQLTAQIRGLPNEITPLPKHQPAAHTAARSVRPAQVGCC